MAQTPYIFDDPYDVADFLRGAGNATNEEIADYLDSHASKFAAYLKRLTSPSITVSDLSVSLRSENDDTIVLARTVLENCLDKNIDDLPIGKPPQEFASKIVTPPTPVTKKTPFLDRITSTGASLRNKISWLDLRLTTISLGTLGAGAVALSYSLSSDVEGYPVTLALMQANANAVHAAVDIGQRAAPIIEEQIERISSGLSSRFEEANQAYILSQSAILDQYPGSYYNPFLVRQLETDANARQYVAWITQAALDNGLNPVRFANQLHRESRQFDPQIVSGQERSSAGALGLAQFMPRTAAHDYGLTENDLHDPQTSIFTAAYMMAELTREYGGDQALAEIAYNGGRGAVEFVQEERTLEPILANLELNRSDIDNDQKNELLEGVPLVQISSQDWLRFMAQRRIDTPTNLSGAWQNQTYTYVREINGTGWEIPHRQWSRQQQSGGLPEHMLYIGTTIAAHAGQLNPFQIETMLRLPNSHPSLFEGLQTSQAQGNITERPTPSPNNG